DFAEAGVRELLEKLRRAIHRLPPFVARACLLDCCRFDVAVACAERLPLERQQAMTLQIPERPVVRQHVEPITRALERPTRFVAAIRAIAEIGPENGCPLVG